MAMATNECPNRKACDRCHAQKLSCKRYGEEACERCLRLKTECKSSPSLRYRKQQAAAAVAAASTRETRRREIKATSASFPTPSFLSTSATTVHHPEQPEVHFEFVRAEDGRKATELAGTASDKEATLTSIGVGLDGGGGGQAGGQEGCDGGGAAGMAGNIRGSRSPKRKRTESENILVPPDFGESNMSLMRLHSSGTLNTNSDGFAEASINIHNTGGGGGGGDHGASGVIAQPGCHEGGGGPESGDFPANHHDHGGPEQVTHEAPMLEMTDFNFESGHAGIFPPTPDQTAHPAQHLSALHPVMVDHHNFSPHHLTGGFGRTGARLDHQHLDQQHHQQQGQTWVDQHLQGPSSASASNTPFLPSTVAEPAVTAPAGHLPSLSVPKQQSYASSPADLSRRPSHPTLDRATKPPRAKLKARQIVLKATLPGAPATASASTSTSPSFSQGHWMPRLSDINARLFELSAVLPSQLERAEGGSSSHHHHHRHGGSSRSSNGKSSRRGASSSSSSSSSAPFPVDEMFKLSQQFAEAIHDATSSSSLGTGGSGRYEEAGNSSSTSSRSGSHHHHHRHRGRSSLNSVNDPGSSMFILSTYVRLLDMYQKVFSCIHSRLPQLDTENGLRHWKLPDVTVGSFAVESTPSLQMSLTIQLAEEFLAQLRVATAGLGPTPGARVATGESSGAGGGGRRREADGSMFSGVVDVSFQAIKTREDSLGQQLADLRRDLDIILDG